MEIAGQAEVVALAEVGLVIVLGVY
jgi:hypothetical protein